MRDQPVINNHAVPTETPKKTPKGNRSPLKSPRSGASSKEEKENVESSPKMNAFEFMMHSRNKVTGRNSPGREVELNQSLDTVVMKQELKARKSRLEGWAAQKAAKRKREYDEIGNCISYKLEKREEKLKKMLQIDCQSDDEVITKRRKCAVIGTESESSNDAKIEMISPVKRKKKRYRMSLNKKEECEENDVKLTPRSVKAWRFKIKLCMDENKPEESENEEKDLEEVATDNSEEANAHGDLKLETASEDSTESQKTDESNETLKEAEIDSIPAEVENSNNRRRSLRTRRLRPKMYHEFDFLDEEDALKNKKKGKKDVKVAPVFLKAAPKPKLDPKEVEARRQFLQSGVPSSLKKEMERQQCAEDVEFDVFPTVSHVQQKTENRFWDLPKVDLNLIAEVGSIEIKPLLFTQKTTPDLRTRGEVFPVKIKNPKKIITEIKTKNPDYPVYKIFNSLYEKCGQRKEKEAPAQKRRGRPKKKVEKPQLVPLVKNEENTQALWTEKYKPTSSSDIIGNHNSVAALKEWLTNWLTFPKSLKKTTDSESEFDITDGDSRDSVKMFGSTVILKGPTGSGKTAAVYAVCNELGFNVLEVNGSSKRTGKRLQQELQEATQSHQVCKKDILSFVNEKKDQPSSKKCVLLIEDVDVVFDQDEGFSTVLSQIITTSKRPIILTTTDEPVTTIQKVLSNYRTILFLPLSSILTIWLQIVCLVEGLYVEASSLEDLLLYNRGDIRRTLLQLQLYVNSGGKKIETCSQTSIDNPVKIEDSNLDLKLDDSCEDIQVHGDCLDIYQVLKHYDLFSLPHCDNLETIWWNLPSILNPSKVENKKKLKMLSQCYDAMAFSDVMCAHSQTQNSLKPKWRTKPKNSLGLEENMSIYSSHDLGDDLAHTVLQQQFRLYKRTWESSPSSFNLAVPGTSERKWRVKQHSCESKLEDALLVGDSLWRKAVAMDYMPCLRSMARAEIKRAANNNKRGNRFYSYLKSLGVRGGENSYKMACELFQIRD